MITLPAFVKTWLMGVDYEGPDPDIKGAMLSGAYQMQSMFRLMSVFVFLMPAVVMFTVVRGMMPWTALIAPCGSCLFVYMTLMKKATIKHRWWWMKRGVILTCRNDMSTVECAEWIDQWPHEEDFAEVTSGCFKFYNKRLARLFQLHWC